MLQIWDLISGLDYCNVQILPTLSHWIQEKYTLECRAKIDGINSHWNLFLQKVLSFGKPHLFILLIFSSSTTFILCTTCICVSRVKALPSCKGIKRKRLYLLCLSLCSWYWVVFPRYQVSPLHFRPAFQHHLSLNCSMHLMSPKQEKFLSETLEMWDSWIFWNKG